MKDRTPEQLRKVVKKYVLQWKTELYLGMWTVNFTIKDVLVKPNSKWEGVAYCENEWQYYIAHIDFSHVMMKDMTEEEISRIVLHELLHTVINEMRNWEKEDGGDHEERVVSHLTMIIDRLGPLTKIKK